MIGVMTSCLTPVINDSTRVYNYWGYNNRNSINQNPCRVLQ